MSQSGVIQRIRILADDEKNLSEFCNKIGRSYGVVSNMFSRGTKPSFDMLLSIIEVYDNLNLRWLFLGEGVMWQEQALKTNDKTIEELEDKILRLKQELEFKDSQLRTYETMTAATNALIEELTGKKIGGRTVEQFTEVEDKSNKKTG